MEEKEREGLERTKPENATEEKPKPSKRKKIVAGVAIAVVVAAGLGLGAAYASGAFSPAPEEPSVQRTDEKGLSFSVEMKGYGEGSSPLIAHIVSEELGTDFYHAFRLGEEWRLDLEQGSYEVSYVSPVNADGSIYRVPEKPAQAEVSDGVGAELEGSLELIPAEDVTQEDVDHILGQVQDAVQNGDESLSGDAGQQVVDQVTGNAGNAPNVDEDAVEEAGENASGSMPDQPAAEPNGNGGSNAGSGSSGSGGGSSDSSGSNGNGSNGSSGNGGSSSSSGESSGTDRPAHVHDYKPHYKTVTDYEYVRHERWRCSKGDFSGTASDVDNHIWSTYGDATHPKGASALDDSWTEKIESGSHREVDYYECSCGARKPAA